MVNLPRDATGIDDDECALAEECVVSAIEDDFAVLRSPDTIDEEKLAALEFFGNWIGDIDQPCTLRRRRAHRRPRGPRGHGRSVSHRSSGQ